MYSLVFLLAFSCLICLSFSFFSLLLYKLGAREEKRIMTTMMMLGFAGCICQAPDRGCM